MLLHLFIVFLLSPLGNADAKIINNDLNEFANVPACTDSTDIKTFMDLSRTGILSPPCGGHPKEVQNYLASDFNEKKVASIIIDEKTIATFYANLSGTQTWTVVTSSPTGLACIYLDGADFVEKSEGQQTHLGGTLGFPEGAQSAIVFDIDKANEKAKIYFFDGQNQTSCMAGEGQLIDFKLSQF